MTTTHPDHAPAAIAEACVHSADGTRIADELAPDPLLVGWLATDADHGALFADELTRAPEDLRPLLATLFAEQRAGALVAVASGDDALALVVVLMLGPHLHIAGQPDPDDYEFDNPPHPEWFLFAQVHFLDGPISPAAWLRGVCDAATAGQPPPLVVG